MELQLEAQSASLASKIKHYLITTMGVTLDEATDEEFYRAFALTLREEVMIAWTACTHTYKKNKARMLYYICMEYMPGRFLGNNITNIHALDLVHHVLKILNRNFEKVVCYESDPGLGNGGLGRLAACFLDSLATQQYPALAYGLRFQYGIFDQEIWNGNQVERPEMWLLHENPWEYRRDTHATSIHYGGRIEGRNNKKGTEVWDLVDCDEVRALAYDIPIIGYKANGIFTVNTLRLWTTKESPRNFQLQRYNAGLLDQAAENTSLTDVLYPNDNNETGKRTRLKQEFLLVSASLQDVMRHYFHAHTDLSSFADKVRIHINDTHPSLAIAELQRLLISEHDLGWEEAFEIVKTCCNFTNHTVLRESLEEWNQNRMHHLLPVHYQIIERLNLDLCTLVRKKFPGDEEKVRRLSILEEGQVRMAHLAVYGSHHVNGVAGLHTEILKKTMFKDFNDLFPDRFINVTNGVTQRRWLLHCNPHLSHFISERIGNKWITDFKEMARLKAFAQDPASQNRFLEIKKQNKQALIDFIEVKNPIRDNKGKPIGQYNKLDVDALFDVQIKRIHEYKRQLMNILHVVMLYQEIKANPSSRIKRCVIFGGKAAPGYAAAKNIVQLICLVARKINEDPVVSAKLHVVFIENYNVSLAEKIIPAADLSEQISTAGMEASGTGNMKLAINGALTIGTEDGANIEMHQAIGATYWPFGFGKKAEENQVLKGSYNPWNIYIHDPLIHAAVNTLHDRTFATNDLEHDACTALYSLLLDSSNGTLPDRYFVLNDLKEYYETQKKVEALYQNPSKWAEYAIQNIAAMGSFSSDESIHNYAKQIWDLKICPCDPQEIARVRAEYSEHDKCRIL
ncbi:MAG: glycogen phosphorylase [Chlamydiota bacterium]